MTNTTPTPADRQEAAGDSIGDPRRAMNADELQEFCISLSLEQDDYTEHVIRCVEDRMLGKPLFFPAAGEDGELPELVETLRSALTECLKAMDIARDTIQPITTAQIKLHGLNPQTDSILDAAAAKAVAALAARAQPAGDPVMQIMIDSVSVHGQRWTASLTRAGLDLSPGRHDLYVAQPAATPADDGLSREQWVQMAERVYRAAGDDEKTARECAAHLADEQDWLGEEIGDPHEEALQDIEGRLAATPPDAGVRELAQWRDPSAELLEVGRKAIEDVLIEWRDARLSEPLRRNGLVVTEKDGTRSDVIRFGPETALRVGMRAIAAALAAQPTPPAAASAAVPAGWRLVPVEPTLEMGWAYLEAAGKASPRIDHTFNHPGYRAMLAAAPTPPAEVEVAQAAPKRGFAAKLAARHVDLGSLGPEGYRPPAAQAAPVDALPMQGLATWLRFMRHQAKNEKEFASIEQWANEVDAAQALVRAQGADHE